MFVHLKVRYYDIFGRAETLLDHETIDSDFWTFWNTIREKSNRLCNLHRGTTAPATYMQLCGSSRRPENPQSILVPNLPFRKMNLDNVNAHHGGCLTDSDAIKLVLFFHAVQHEEQTDRGGVVSHSLKIWSSYF
jgi:hypothetical protein